MVESPWHKAIPYLVFTLIVFAVLVLMTLIFGQVSGEEFSPDTFERRRFHYFQIPIVRFQVTGMKRRDQGIGMADTVEDHAPNVDSAATVKTWDLVSSQRTGADKWLGDAKILCDLLTTEDTKRAFLWQTWSEKYPHLADRFWPVVADTAQAGSYILMPDLFELAGKAGFNSASNVDDDSEDEEESDDEEDKSDTEDDEDKEEMSDKEEPTDESDASNDEEEKDAKEKDAGNEDESGEEDEDGSAKPKAKKKKKARKKKQLTPEQMAEADQFGATLNEFMARETIVLADQFESAGELVLARRAYELATKYSDDPAALENFDRLSEVAPEEEEPASEQPEADKESESGENEDPFESL